jgi:4-amino-4-deoxychorismate lyase
MSRLVETIKIQNGRVYNLPFHQFRFDQTRKDVFNETKKISLREKIIQQGLPGKGLFKCRVEYEPDIIKIEFLSYQFPKVSTLKLVHDDHIFYDHKWVDRPALDSLFLQKGTASEIIIIKGGKVTDGYYYNIVFEKSGTLFTSDTPLLAGTQRSSLLKKGIIKEKEIRETDIFLFEKIHLINALTLPGKLVVDIKNGLI